MAQDQIMTIDTIAGTKNDQDAKQIPIEYMNSIINYNYPVQGIKGLAKILFPSVINRLGTSPIDGLYEYRYLDAGNSLQTEEIGIANGIIYKNCLNVNTPVAVTFSATPTNTVNRNTHGFLNGAAVSFSVSGAGALPAALTANVIYFVVNTAANTFQVALTQGGSPITFATAGTTPTQLVEGNPTVLKTGLIAGKCSFVTFQDNLFIADGKNYPNVYCGALGVVAEMGAPGAVVVASGGNIDVGTHYYAMTYGTAGGEEIIGSISNTITASSGHAQATLHLPIGYAGTLTRNIYRTLAGGTTLKLLYSVPDNTTLTYTDNIADASITGAATIPATNNELPKPYFITVANQKLYAAKVDLLPTQRFMSDTNLQVFDSANFVDLANYGNDNTAISAVAFDYNKVVFGTGKNLIFEDPATGDIIRTRGYVGVKDGYSMKLTPAFGDYPGGLMFVSSLNDVRLIQGTQAAAVFQTIDNIRTDSWSQDIRGDLDKALASYTNIYAEFYDNKYHLIIDGIKEVFDIRARGWTRHDIKSASFTSNPRVMAILNSKLYNGQSDGNIELEYQNVKYKGEEVNAKILWPFIQADTFYKWVKKMVFWFTVSTDTTISISTTLDANVNFVTSGSFTLQGGYYDPTYFDPEFYLTDENTMDYRVININNPCRWIQPYLECSAGNMTLQKWSILGTPLENKERR